MANPIKTFIDEWSSRGYEKGDTQIFWLTLFRDVFGIDKPERFLKFEVPVKINKSNCLIDAL
ncbi:MAG: hypothetical protein IJ563_06760, partial [Selenomonadaceae bacterium]|nr:hypothetical protein [Selenomonadaceae bacterium]